MNRFTYWSPFTWERKDNKANLFRVRLLGELNDDIIAMLLFWILLWTDKPNFPWMSHFCKIYHGTSWDSTRGTIRSYCSLVHYCIFLCHLNGFGHLKDSLRFQRISPKRTFSSVRWEKTQLCVLQEHYLMSDSEDRQLGNYSGTLSWALAILYIFSHFSTKCTFISEKLYKFYERFPFLLTSISQLHSHHSKNDFLLYQVPESLQPFWLWLPHYSCVVLEHLIQYAGPCLSPTLRLWWF